jgi:hypothetical protein
MTKSEAYALADRLDKRHLEPWRSDSPDIFAEAADAVRQLAGERDKWTLHTAEEFERGRKQCNELRAELAALREQAKGLAVMPLEEAIRIARLWRGGKMIGGDEDDVRNALLLAAEQAEEYVWQHCGRGTSTHVGLHTRQLIKDAWLAGYQEGGGDDAKTLRGYMTTFGETPSMTASRLKVAQEQAKGLAEALEFYAAKETWQPGNEYRTGDVAAFVDEGEIARAALARYEESKGL